MNYTQTPVNNLKTKGTTGETICHKKKTTIKTKNGAYVSSVILRRPYWFGNMANKSFEPSKGGSGIRLNIAKIIFIITI